MITKQGMFNLKIYYRKVVKVDKCKIGMEIQKQFALIFMERLIAKAKIFLRKKSKVSRDTHGKKYQMMIILAVF